MTKKGVRLMNFQDKAISIIIRETVLVVIER